MSSCRCSPSTTKQNGGIQSWDYGEHADPHRVARELNGRFLVNVTEKDGKEFAAGKQVSGFAQLRDDGSTMSGNWIYCGGYTEEGNLAARRDTTDAPNKIGLHPKWGWTWPMNRRILYNRASVNRKGEPFNPRKWVIRWNAEKNACKTTRAPIFRPVNSSASPLPCWWLAARAATARRRST